jgi:hypothetical protein
MPSSFSAFRRARRAWLETAAAAIALISAAPVLARVAPTTTELARIPVSSGSLGYRRTPHIDRYYRSTVGLYE